jgi:hypothetical protein
MRTPFLVAAGLLVAAMAASLAALADGSTTSSGSGASCDPLVQPCASTCLGPDGRPEIGDCPPNGPH